MSFGKRGLEAAKTVTQDVSLAAATTTAVIDLNGGTLVGVSIPELTSTSFTVQVSDSSSGTFRTVRDPFGLYGTEDTNVSFAIGTTSAGYYPVPVDLSYGFRYIKLVFSSSETATISVFYRNVE